jgi:hypothetical protein
MPLLLVPIKSILILLFKSLVIVFQVINIAIICHPDQQCSTMIAIEKSRYNGHEDAVITQENDRCTFTVTKGQRVH